MMNKKKGGSIVSDRITNMVSPETYIRMNKEAQNLIGGKKKKKGGSIASDKVVNLITPETYVKLDRETQNLTGGKKLSCREKKCTCKKGGNGNVKHIRELFEETNYKLNNRVGGKKGGSKTTIGLDYSGLKSLGLPTPSASHQVSPISNEIQANYQYSTQPNMVKVTEYGSVYDGKNNKFSYNQELIGGENKVKKRQLKKTIGKKTALKK